MLGFFRLYGRLWNKHQIPTRAAALTYAFLLSIIPLLAVCLSVFSLVVDLKKISDEFKLFLFKHLSAGAGNLVGKTMDSFLEKIHFKTLGYFGSLMLLVIAFLMLAHIESSINRIWSIRTKKKLWKRVVIYNLILVLGPVSVSLSLASSTLVSNLFPQFFLKAHLGALFVGFLFLALTYKVFPNKKVRWLPALFSALLVVLAAELAKWGYAGYVSKALIHNRIYGSLAAFPLFLIWIFVNWMLFLSGALLTFMLQTHNPFRKKEPHS